MRCRNRSIRTRTSLGYCKCEGIFTWTSLTDIKWRHRSTIISFVMCTTHTHNCQATSTMMMSRWWHGGVSCYVRWIAIYANDYFGIDAFIINNTCITISKLLYDTITRITLIDQTPPTYYLWIERLDLIALRIICPCMIYRVVSVPSHPIQ